MRKTFLTFVFAAFGSVLTSQAVVISWASENLLSGTTSATLVYVSNGSTPTYSGTLQNGEAVASASGYAIDGSTLYEQTSTDGAPRSSGAYYVVIFNDVDQYAVSTVALAYNDAKISTSEMDPPVTFSATSFGEWTAVPEPCAAALLCLGAAAVALRRRQRG